MAIPEPQTAAIWVVAMNLMVTQAAAEFWVQSSTVGTGLCFGQERQLGRSRQLTDIEGFEQTAVEKTVAELGEGLGCLVSPALQVIASADVVIGEITLQVQF